MTDKRISIRLAMDGKSEFKRDVSELETHAKASFGNVKGSIDGATASTDDLVASLKRASVEESAALANASRSSTAKGRASARDLIGIDPTSAAKAKASAEAINAELKVMDKQAQAVRYSLDPLAMATDRYAAAEATLDKLLKNGKITLEQHGAALKNEKAALDVMTEAHNKGAKAVGLSSSAIRMMAVSTLPDLAQGLLAGQFSFASFVNQAGQAVQIAGMQPGGFGAAMRSLTSPAALAAGAIGLVGGALFLTAKAGYDFGKSISEAQLAVMGIGAASRLTGTQVVSIAAQAAKAGDISVSAAETGAAAMLRAGMVNKDVLGDAIALTKDYGLVTGRELPAAQDALAKALADPVNGVKQLNAELLLGDANWQKNVISMAQAGDKAGAVAEIISTMKGKIGDASKEVYGMAGAMDALGNKMSNFWHGFGQLVNPDPATILNRMADFNKVNPGKVDPNYFGGSDSTFQKSYLLFWKEQNAQAAKDGAAAKALASQDAQANLNFLDPLSGKKSELDNSGKRLEADLKAGNITLDQAIKARAGLKRQYEALNKQENPTAPGANRAATLAREAESVKVNTAATLDLAEAYLTSSDAALKAEATRKAMTEATRKGTDVAAAVQREMDLTNAQAVLGGAKAAAASRDQADALKFVNDQVAAGIVPARDAQQALQQEAVLRPLIALRTKMQGDALDKLNRVIEAATKGLHDLNTEQQRSAVQAATQATRDQTAALKDQLDVTNDPKWSQNVELAKRAATRDVDQRHIDPNSQDAKDRVGSAIDQAQQQNANSAADYTKAATDDLDRQRALMAVEQSMLGQKQSAIDKAIALKEAELDIDRAGVDLTKEQKDAILGAVAAREDENAVLERGKAIQGEISGLQDSVYGRAEDYLTSFKYSWQSLGDVAKSELQDIMSEVIKLAVMNPFKNWALGQDNPTLKESGGLISTIMSALYKPSTAASAAASYDWRSDSIIPAHAAGTDFAPGGLSRLAENGMELVINPQYRNVQRGSRVLNASETRRAMFGGQKTAVPAGPTVVKFDVSGVADPLVSFFRQLETKLNQGLQDTHDQAVETAKRALPGNLSEIDLLG